MPNPLQAERDESLRRQLEETTHRAESLRRVIESISGELALAPLLERVLASAVELLAAQNGVIGLVVATSAGPAMRMAASVNLPPQERSAELPAGVGLAGRVLSERRPIRLDRYGDIETNILPALADHAVLGVPIWWAGQVIGFFGLGSPPPRRFVDAEVETLELLARHAAIAIENARRYERERRRTEQLALIARIGRTLTADLPLDELLRSAADSIHELLGYPNVAIPLIDPDDPDMLVIEIFGGAYRTLVGGVHRQPITEGIMGEAVRTHQVQLSNDVASDPRYITPPGASDIQAELTVPIISGEQVLGVLNVESGERFSEEDAASLQIVADQLSAAITNARLFEARQRRTERLELIARVGQRIAARLDPDELFVTTVEELHGQLGYDHASLFLLDPDDQAWLVKRASASRWRGNPIGYRVSIERGIMGAAARQRRPELVNDIAADPRYIAVPDADGLRAELAMPILLGNRLLGVLDVASLARLSMEDITAIQIISDQLAVAIENTRLAERGQQLAVLEERRRLARELHDSVTQSLFSMSLLAQALPELWNIDREEARAGLGQIRDMTRSALAEMRALLFELQPAGLGQKGLAYALREHATVIERRAGIAVVVDIARDPALPAPVEQAFFRIAQEALSNAARHARARRVQVTLRGPTPARMAIADDGQGFLIERVGDGCFGLISMRERAAAVGARLRVDSALGQGTEVVVEWPDPDRPSSAIHGSIQ
jgi:signal transduction histidine kinase